MTNTVIDTNKATVSRFLAGTHSDNIEDVDVIDETVVPHIVCHGFPVFPFFPDGEFRDRESYKAFFRIFHQSFSDMTFETLKMIATEDFVSAHWEIWTTHSGTFNGIDPDGARVAAPSPSRLAQLLPICSRWAPRTTDRFPPYSLRFRARSSRIAMILWM